MALTDTSIRNAKPGKTPAGRATKKAYKLSDGGGLYLEVAPSGGKWWRLKYRFHGKEKRLSLGTYPEVPLAGKRDSKTGAWLEGAREKRERAQRQLAEGIDPSAERKIEKIARLRGAEITFELVAREWWHRNVHTWAESHAQTIIGRFERDVFPWLGERPIAEIKPFEVLGVLRRIEERGAIESAHRVKQMCGQVFRYGVATARVERDPCVDLKGALPPPVTEHHAAITDPDKIGGLLRAIDSYEGSFITRCLLKFAPLVFVRPGELRGAEWSEVDFDNAQWNIDASRMKMGLPHLVPLATQALAILRELHPVTGATRYLFPSPRSVKRPMSDNTILGALRRMGFSNDEMTAHGFRAMARTLMDEVLHVPPHLIEHQLAHAVRDPNGRAYNRTTHLLERRQMMQQWADYLVGLKATLAPTGHQEPAQRAQRTLDP